MGFENKFYDTLNFYGIPLLKDKTYFARMITCLFQGSDGEKGEQGLRGSSGQDGRPV